MNFSKFIMMAVITNLLLVIGLFTLQNNVELSEDNTNIYGLVTDLSTTNFEEGAEDAGDDGIQRRSIGNPITWGVAIKNLIEYTVVGVSGYLAFYSENNVEYPITMSIFLLLNMFMIVYNLYVIIVSYRFFKNGQG